VGTLFDLTPTKVPSLQDEQISDIFLPVSKIKLETQSEGR